MPTFEGLVRIEFQSKGQNILTEDSDGTNLYVEVAEQHFCETPGHPSLYFCYCFQSKPGLGADPSKPKSKKKKELRKEKALAKLNAAGLTETDYLAKKSKLNQEKTLEDLTSCEYPTDSRHTFEIRLVNAQTTDATFKKSYNESYNVYKKYQMAIHKESPSKCSLDQFKRFLCNSSLIGKSEFGAFHQQYVVDGKIIAVGVIDILPHCVSSVYLYYDPDYAFLSPGTLTSLYEIAFTRQMQAKVTALKFYYMGFYIHSCPKMRYKAKYQPSWLLCPKTYHWVSVKQSLPLLDKAKYAILHPEHQIMHELARVEETFVLFGNQAMKFALYKEVTSTNSEGEDEEVQEYTQLIGYNLSKRILLYRH